MADDNTALLISVLIVATLVLLIYHFRDKIRAFLRKYHLPGGGSAPDDSGDSTGPVGPSKPTCKNPGDTCSKQSDCCETLTCTENKICVAMGLQPVTSAFFLGHEGKCITRGDDDFLSVSDAVCDWEPGIIPRVFWFWDGQSNLVIKVLEKDSAGNIVGVTNMYVVSPQRAGGYVTLAQKSGDNTKVLLTSQGAIYSTDYSICADIDATGHMVWKSCTGMPTIFTIDQPSACSTTTCKSDLDCCPPYGTCNSGQCSKCFGNPLDYQKTHCNNETSYVTCGDDGVYHCKSECDGMSITCPTAHTGTCMVDENGKYFLSCVWQCQDNSGAHDCGTESPMCMSGPMGWEWQCPIDPCDQPTPSSSSAPAYSGNGYTVKVNDPNGGFHYQNPNNPSAPWIYPHWDCHTQTWSYLRGCNELYKQTCSPENKAICSADTAYEWQCVSSAEALDMCGLSATTGDCGRDAICFDVSACTGSQAAGTAYDWRWICPSSDNTTACELIKIYDWQYPATLLDDASGVQHEVYFKDVNTPIFPTVQNNICRSAGASDIDHPEARIKIGNPKGNLIEINNVFQFFPDNIGVMYNGSDQYIPTLHVSDEQWHCMSPNPCYPNGVYSNNDGSNHVVEIMPQAGEYGPPNTAELLSVGKCSCNAGFAGKSCEYNSSICQHGGVIQPCNVSGGRCIANEYACSCQPGYYGLHCQFTQDQCSNQGTPDGDMDTLSCICDYPYSGSNCSDCAVSVPTVPLQADGPATRAALAIYGTNEVLINSSGMLIPSSTTCDQCYIYQRSSDNKIMIVASNNQYSINLSGNSITLGQQAGAYFWSINKCGFISDGRGNVIALNAQGSLVLVNFNTLTNLTGLVYLSSFENNSVCLGPELWELKNGTTVTFEIAQNGGASFIGSNARCLESPVAPTNFKFVGTWPTYQIVGNNGTSQLDCGTSPCRMQSYAVGAPVNESAMFTVTPTVAQGGVMGLYNHSDGYLNTNNDGSMSLVNNLNDERSQWILKPAVP